MAEAIYERSYKEWEPAWKQVPGSYRTPWMLDAERALTALLTIADVTMKETENE